MIESGQISSLPVFLDSPLAINVTNIYRGFTRYLRPEVQKQIAAGDDIFDFDGLKFTSTTSESQAIKGEKGLRS